MKKFGYVVVAVWVVVAFAQTYRAGERRAWRAADREYARVMSERVAAGIAGYQRVQTIREEAEYRRGFTTCQEQF